jgi:hypothetical protein
MRDKYAKRDIKLKHNFMNIIIYMVRHNEHVVPPEPTRRVGVMKPDVDQSSPWIRRYVVPPESAPQGEAVNGC